MGIGTEPGSGPFQGFEWDEAKRAANLAKHGIDFEDARAIWLCPVAQRRSDWWAEERYVAIGKVNSRIIAVVWTPRGGRRRILSARVARRNERESYQAFLERLSQGQD
jgi:uncharacterized DUF497 family protein